MSVRVIHDARPNETTAETAIKTRNTIDLESKTTTLHVHHAFLHNYNFKLT